MWSIGNMAGRTNGFVGRPFRCFASFVDDDGMMRTAGLHDERIIGHRLVFGMMAKYWQNVVLVDGGDVFVDHRRPRLIALHLLA
jgi:hypothetical protein